MRKYPKTCTLEDCPLARESEVDILINAGRGEGEPKGYTCFKTGKPRRDGNSCLMNSYRSHARIGVI